MRILVTGGAGFIASHVVDGYLAAGNDVAVVDDLSTGARANLNPQARFYEVDICDAAAMKACPSSASPADTLALSSAWNSHVSAQRSQYAS